MAMKQSKQPTYAYEDSQGRFLSAEQQLKFLCPKSYYERLKSEKVLQKRALQDLLNHALELAFSYWEQDRRITRDFERECDEDRALNRGLVQFKTESFTLQKGERRRVQMWIDFMRELPEETVNGTRQLIQDSLRFFRSSRLKRPESPELREENSSGESGQ